jgi:hypothetical protein
MVAKAEDVPPLPETHAAEPLADASKRMSDPRHFRGLKCPI